MGPVDRRGSCALARGDPRPAARRFQARSVPRRRLLGAQALLSSGPCRRHLDHLDISQRLSGTHSIAAAAPDWPLHENGHAGQSVRGVGGTIRRAFLDSHSSPGAIVEQILAELRGPTRPDISLNGPTEGRPMNAIAVVPERKPSDSSIGRNRRSSRRTTSNSKCCAWVSATPIVRRRRVAAPRRRSCVGLLVAAFRFQSPR